jgi:hypothetical protein
MRRQHREATAAGIGLGTTAMYMQRTTSDAAGNGLSTTINCLMNLTRARVATWPRPTCTKAGNDSATPPPCSVAAFVINSEPHTRARPSARLCAGPELARCVYYGHIRAIAVLGHTTCPHPQVVVISPTTHSPMISPTHKRTEGRAPVWGSEFTSKRRRTTGGDPAETAVG